MGLLNHSAVPGVMSIDDAHRVMQLHMNCTVSICDLKRQAKVTLIAEGRMVPDTHRDHVHAMGY